VALPGGLQTPLVQTMKLGQSPVWHGAPRLSSVMQVPLAVLQVSPGAQNSSGALHAPLSCTSGTQLKPPSDPDKQMEPAAQSGPVPQVRAVQTGAPVVGEEQ
jgi:hypothetical protein